MTAQFATAAFPSIAVQTPLQPFAPGIPATSTFAWTRPGLGVGGLVKLLDAQKVDEVESEESVESREVIVIHPGSRQLRIGKASDSLPVSIPHVIARRIRRPSWDAAAGGRAEEQEPESGAEEQEESGPTASLAEYIKETERLVKLRMKQAKLRPVMNASAQIASFNANSEPEIISDLNDPYRIEWIDVNEPGLPAYFVGEKALRVPLKNGPYELRYPFRDGLLNWEMYKSPQELSSDLECIWSKVLCTELKISRDKWKDCNIVLVLADLFPRDAMEFLLDLVLVQMGFRAATVYLESQCATWGAGISHACVVDVGAQKTTIACVEDGLPIPASRLFIKYGGDDIMALFHQLLRDRSKFPYRDLELSNAYDRIIIEQAYEAFCTFQVEDITIQACECTVRTPYAPTRMYKFKLYDEAMMAPLCLFFPERIDVQSKLTTSFGPMPSGWKTSTDGSIASDRFPNVFIYPLFASGFPIHEKPVVKVSDADSSTVPGQNVSAADTMEIDMETETADEHEWIPLDNAISMSILSTSSTLSSMAKKQIEDVESAEIQPEPEGPTLSSTEETRIHKMLSSILLIGGGMSRVHGVREFLADRIIYTCRYICAEVFQFPLDVFSTPMDRANVLPCPRDMDPRMLCWKGGAVVSRLETFHEECLISRNEWKVYGSVLAQERFLFQW